MLGAVFEVSNTLGAGFLEKVYQHATSVLCSTSSNILVEGMRVIELKSAD
jgi:hypothetical protein